MRLAHEPAGVVWLCVFDIRYEYACFFDVFEGAVFFTVFFVVAALHLIF